MPNRNNFWKTLLGQNAQVLISKAVAYTAQTTYAAFVTASAEGEMGIFNADTGATLTGAAGSTVNLFVAVKRDSQIERSVTFQIGNVKSNRTAYAAPVKQATDITLGSTRATLTLQTLTFIAKAFGVNGNNVTITYAVAGANTPLTIGVAGSAITVNCATNGASASISTGDQVVAAILASPAAMALLSSVYVSGTGSTVITAAASTPLAGGTAPAAPTSGDVFGVKVLETTPGYQPFPTYMWDVTAKTGDTFDSLVNKLVLAINSTTSIANRDRDLIVTATYNAATDDITLTAVNFGVTFRVQLYGKFATIGDVAYTTAMAIGSGFPTQVKLFQDAGDIYKGVTTNYPLQGANPENFGKPTDFVDPTQTYNIYSFAGNRSEVSKSPLKVWNHQHNVIVICPSSGTSPEATIKTVFGL